jgi:hypothetical protein
MAYLVLLTGVGAGPSARSDELVAILSLAALPAAAIFGVLKLMKRRRKIHIIRLAVSPQGPDGLQFTIRHLLTATAVVAAILATGRGLRSIGFGRNLELYAVVAVVGLCVILIELAILWATLCAKRPGFRLGIVVPPALMVGAIPPFYLPTMLEGSGQYVAWPATFGLEATITAASLLVVRSCGWRLVSGDDSRVERSTILTNDQPPGA